MKASPDRAGHRAVNAVSIDRYCDHAARQSTRTIRRGGAHKAGSLRSRRVSPCTIAEARIADQGAEQFVLELTVAGD